jgi:hypothetical protein
MFDRRQLWASIALFVHTVGRSQGLKGCRKGWQTIVSQPYSRRK